MRTSMESSVATNPASAFLRVDGSAAVTHAVGHLVLRQTHAQPHHLSIFPEAIMNCSFQTLGSRIVTSVGEYVPSVFRAKLGAVVQSVQDIDTEIGALFSDYSYLRWKALDTQEGTHTFVGCAQSVLQNIGVDAGFVTTIAPAEEAVLVTTPNITALRDADRVAGLLECDGIKDIKIIVNRVRPDLVKGEDMMSALDVQEMLGLPLVGVVPEDAEVIRSRNRGVPLVLNDLPTPAGLVLEQATWRLVERDAMIAVMVEEQERPKKKGGFFSFFSR
ncbi:hypothetical protein ACP70R_042109 [Stipagrostis hirtigluma subsp. patula]